MPTPSDLAVIVPELVATRWYHYLLHNQTASVQSLSSLQRLATGDRDQCTVVPDRMKGEWAKAGSEQIGSSTA